MSAEWISVARNHVINGDFVRRIRCTGEDKITFYFDGGKSLAVFYPTVKDRDRDWNILCRDALGLTEAAGHGRLIQ